MMDSVLKDLLFAIRSLLKRPGFTAITLIALALGIGANTAIFSLVNAVILRPLPYPDSDRLVWVYGNIRNGGNRARVSPLDYLDYRNQKKTFQKFAALIVVPLPATLTGSGEPERLQASAVTGNFFQAYGVSPVLGRGFTLDNEKPGQNDVTVLSYALWQKLFGGDPGIINKSIVLEGRTCQVLGVMGQDVVFPQPADLWMPLNFDAAPEMKLRKAHFLRPIGRLKPGVTLAQAQADTDLIAAQLERQFPESNTGWNLRLIPLREQLVGSTRTTLFILFGAVGFVLLIACANVANLLLGRAAARQKEIALRTALGASRWRIVRQMITESLLLVRAATRQKEIALRTALGASRWRIVRQMITESLLLAICGGALGALFATWGVQLVVKLSEGNLPPTAKVRIDATVLGFTLLISVLTGLLFCLAPALRTARVNLIDSLKDGTRGAGESTLKDRTRSLLVVFESAVAAMLLIAAGLLVRSLVALQNVNPGFDPNNVLTMRVDLSRTKYNTDEKTTHFFEQLETRVAGLPGVENVGLITELPL